MERVSVLGELEKIVAAGYTERLQDAVYFLNPRKFGFVCNDEEGEDLVCIPCHLGKDCTAFACVEKCYLYEGEWERRCVGYIMVTTKERRDIKAAIRKGVRIA